MGSEQHTASLKNRPYKQKIPEGSHPPGSFLYQLCPRVGQAVGTKALQSLGQRGQVAAGVIPCGGKRGQCQNQQKNQRIQKMKAIDLSERQKQILAYMDAGVEYSTEQVAEKIGLKGPRTRQLLNELVNMELLACIGTTKKRRYIKV